MELNLGFKKTESGIIPEDWDSSSIGDYAFVTKLAGFEYTLYFDYSKSGPIIAIRALNIKDGSLNLEDIHTIPKATSDALPRSRLYKGDLVMSYVGTLGRVAVIPENNKFHLAPNVAKISVNREKVSPAFLSYFLNGFKGQKAILDAAASTTQAALSMRNLRKLFFPRPSLAEQEAIAEALSDADAFIESLEQIIAKKRQIKRGAMQELLTGKRRLPGFYGEWKIKPLRELCRTIVDGTHFTPRYVEIGIPFYSVENVTANDFVNIKFISVQEHNILIKRCKPEKGDILITRIGSIGDTKLIDWDVEASIYVSLALLKVNDLIDARYLYCYTKSRQFIRDIEDRSLLNASPKKINMGNIGEIPIPVPGLSEQITVADIFLDLDAEIAALESKLAKARQIKQGMMQELLTGRIRLI